MIRDHDQERLQALREEVRLSNQSWCSKDGRVQLRIDVEAYAFNITAHPEHDSCDITTALAHAGRWGLEPLDDDECEPELTSEGCVRIWLTPIVPADVTEACREVGR